MAKFDFLLIGPYPFGNPSQIGGATILYKLLIDSFNERNIKNSVIAINYYHGKLGNLLNILSVCFKAFYLIPLSRTVFMNFNRRGYMYLAPIIAFYSWLFNKRIVLRIFGGDAIEIYQMVGTWKKSILSKLFKNCNFLFFETKSEVNFFNRINSASLWFPNSRVLHNNFISRTFEKKFVYISQIKETKGILLLIDVFNDLDTTYQLKIYGPIIDPDLAWIKSTKYYCGVLDFEEVNHVLDQNNVLVLPTYHSGEGYPGIIIEAYMMSIPVITTDWKSIKDIVLHEISGILIAPKSRHALRAAIVQIDKDNYTVLNQGAFKMTDQFNSRRIHEQVIKRLIEAKY
ncbi:MAG: glycosyltransferase [Saprospiraceae bacterium]